MWATCFACRGHKQADPEHTRLQDECRFGAKHNVERRRGAKAGILAPLFLVAENDDDEHGAPFSFYQQTCLYADESEDVVGPEQISNLD